MWQAAPLSVVFIIAGGLGWGELGCYGQKKIPTPNIDMLAARGTRFTQHYSGAPVCAPSRCVLMTGKNGTHLSGDAVSFTVGDFFELVPRFGEQLVGFGASLFGSRLSPPWS